MNVCKSYRFVGVALTLAALVLALPASNAWGITYFTNSTGNGLWSDPANWATNPALVSDGYREIDNGLTCKLDTAATQSTGWLMVGGSASWGNPGGNGTLNVDGGSLSLTDLDPTLYIGYGATGTVNIINGGSISTAHVHVGDVSSVGNLLKIDNGTLNVAGQLIVGNNAGGEMDVNGTVNGGNWVVVGWHPGAVGTLRITGGTMGFSDASNSRTHLGWEGGTGHLVLDGGTLKTTQIVNGGTADLVWNGGTVKVQARPAGNDWQTNPFMYNLNSAVIQSRGAIVDTNATDALIAQPLLQDPSSPGGGFTKNGEGTLVLAGTNTYTGDTVVNRGTLKIGGGPAAYFSFDRATGTTVPNAGFAVNRNGTLINGASITTGGSGILGESLSIAAQNQWMQISNNLYLGDQQYTISGWFKDLYSPASWRTFVRGSAWGHQVIVESGTERLGSFDPGGFHPSGYDMSSVLSGWHQIAAVGTPGNDTRLYIDGVYVGSTGSRSYMDIFAIGNIQGGNQAFAQNIDEFYAWNRALTDGDISNLYASGMGALASINQPVLAPATNVKVGPEAALDLNLSQEKVTSLTMTGNAAIAFGVDANSGWGGRISTTGSMVQSGELRWSVVAGAPALGQSFQLFDWGGGTRTGSFDKFTWTPLSGNLTWDITHLSSDGAVSVIPSGSSQWAKPGGDSWNLPTSWTGGLITDGVDQVATFGAAMAAPGGTVKVQGPVTVGELHFDNAAAAYTIAGPSPVTMQVSAGSALVNVVNGSHRITAPMTLASPTTVQTLNPTDSLAIAGAIGGAASLTKSGPGTLTLSGVNGYTGGTVLNGGTLRLTDPSTAGSLPAGAALIVDASDAGSLVLDASGRVQLWKDTSGNSRDFSQTDAARRPSVVPNAMNGLPVLHMNATGSQTMINGTNFPAAVTVLYVSRQTGSNNYRVLSGLNNNWLLGYHGGLKDRAYFEGWVNDSAANSDNGTYLYSTTIAGLGSNTSVYNDGGLIASNQGGVTGPNGLSLNGYTATSEFSDADVAQVVVYDHVLTDAERASAEAYLAGKWGISLSVLPDYAPLTLINGTLDLGAHNEAVGPTTAKGSGAVNIASTGGKLTVNGDLQVIENSALTQTGGSTRVNAATYAGVNGSQGKFTLSGNATLDTEYLRVGQNSAAAVPTSGDFLQSGTSHVNVRNSSMDPTDIGYNTISGGTSVASYIISENATFQGNQLTVGAGAGANGTMVVKDNAKVSLVDWIIVGRDGGTGSLTIQDNGVVDAEGNRGNSRTHLAWNGGSAELHLNGGNLRTSQIYNGGTANMWWNGGTVTVVRRSDWGDFLTGLNNVYVGANGAKIDTNSIDAVFSQPLLADPAAPGGGLIKSGKGTLTLSRTNTYTGDTVVNGGTLKLAGGPAAYFSFDRSVGTTVPNAGGVPNHDGVLINGASITSGGSGRYGEAMSIASQSQMLQVNNAGVPLGTNWTISAWFKDLYPVGSWRTLSRGYNADHQAIIRDSGTDLGTYTSAGGFATCAYDTSGVMTGWHQLTAVGSGGSTQFYIDGAWVGASGAQSTSDVFAIGNYQGGGQAFAQNIDEFYVFNRALSDSDVNNLYNQGTAALAGISTPILDPATNVRVGTNGALDVNLSRETVNSLTMTGNAAISFGVDGNTGYNGRITTAGPVSMSGELRWDLIAGDPVVGQTFQLFSGGSIAGSFSKYTWTPLSGGRTWDITRVNVDGTVAVIASGSSKWNKNVGNSWNQPGSWAGNLIPDGVDQTASFLGAMAAPGGTVNVQGPVTVGTMEFDNPSASYEIAGPSPVTMQVSFGNAAINVFSGSHRISAAMTLGSPTAVSVANAPAALTIAGPIGGSGGLVLSGPGTLRLSGANTYAGGTTVEDGTLVVAAENLPATGTAIINGGSLVFEQGTSGVYAGQLGGAGQVSKIGAGTLTLAGANWHGSTVLSAGKLDAAAPGSLGAGPVTLNAGTLRVGVHADGFNGDGRGWTVNSVAIGTAPFAADALTLTDNIGGEARSAFFNAKIPLAGAFTAHFTYTASGDHSADGATIMLQNDPRGASALGGAGGSLGYVGIVNSAAIALNLYPPNNPWNANSGTNVFTGGTVTTPYGGTGAVNIGNGDPINVTLTYDPVGLTLTETLVDPIAGTSFTQVLPGVDLPAVIGGTEAYLGFSGATGGAVATQVISNFSFSSGTSAYGNDVVVPAGASPTIALAPPAANVSMGALSMGSGATLNIRPDTAAAANQAYTLTLGATTLAGNATFDVANNGAGTGTLALGEIGGGAAANLLAKTGNGTLVLAGHTATMALAFPGTVRSEAGTLLVTDSLALQGATLDMHTGDLGAVDMTTGGLTDITLGGLQGTRNLLLPAGPVTVGGNGVSTTYSGNLTGGTTLTKIGSGSLTLGGATAFTGTVVSSGELVLASANALAAGSSLTIGGGGMAAMGQGPSAAASQGTVSAAAVPEPGSLALLAAGILAGLAAWLRRK